jgi:hypothetical protein
VMGAEPYVQWSNPKPSPTSTLFWKPEARPQPLVTPSKPVESPSTGLIR